MFYATKNNLLYTFSKIHVLFCVVNMNSKWTIMNKFVQKKQFAWIKKEKKNNRSSI